MSCRLLYVVGQLGPGGLERQLCFLLQAIDRDRYRPEVVVWTYREDDTYVSRIRKLGVPVHSFPNTLSGIRKLVAFRRMAVQIKPDVIHSYSFHTNFAAWWAAFGRKRVAVGAVRSNFINDKRSSGVLLGSLCARWPRMQIYNNSAAAHEARNSCSLFTPKKALVVRNGLDLALFHGVPLSANGRGRILGVGSLLEYKRWDRLLRAAATLKELGLDFTMEIAGGGPLREALQMQAQDLRISGRVKFLGHVDDVRPMLQKSTFLAHTAEIEGCPNVIMEAMACGRAVVATAAGDIPSLVEDGKTGFVVPRRGDDATLIKCLATLIENRELCRQMGEAGRAKAEREFGLTRLVEETLAGYRAAGWRENDCMEFRRF